MVEQDYYGVLGVEKGATEREIKMAFKKLARKYHPDVAENKEEAEVKFREINEAYGVLADKDKRRMYDQFGHAGVKSGGSYSGFGDWPFGGTGAASGFGDIFEMMFDMGGMGSTRSRPRSRAQRGRDLRKDVEITLEEAYTGTEIEFTMEMYQPCPVCNGRRTKPGTGLKECGVCHGAGAVRNIQNTMFGQIVTNTPCSNCQGEGQIPEQVCEECHGEGRTIGKENISVKIPPGVEDGMRLRLPNKGEAGMFGGPTGDLYVFISILEHDFFFRQGNNLIAEIPIGFADAALGAEKEFKSFEGLEKIDIKAGTQSDTLITISGKGMPDVRSGRKGDLIVKLKVITPTRLTDKQKKLLQAFGQVGPQFHMEKKGFFGKLYDAITGKGK